MVVDNTTSILVGARVFRNVRYLHNVSCSSDLFSAGTRSRTIPVLQTIYIAAAADEARFLIRVASRAARDDVAEGSNRRKRGVQNQNEDARSSRIAAPSQPAMGFTTNTQVNQVSGPSRLPLSSLRQLAPLPTVSFQAIFDPPVINMALVAVGFVNLIQATAFPVRFRWRTALTSANSPACPT
jgi:hypothetical protein